MISRRPHDTSTLDVRVTPTQDMVDDSIRQPSIRSFRITSPRRRSLSLVSPFTVLVVAPSSPGIGSAVPPRLRIDSSLFAWPLERSFLPKCLVHLQPSDIQVGSSN